MLKAEEMPSFAIKTKIGKTKESWCAKPYRMIKVAPTKAVANDTVRPYFSPNYAYKLPPAAMPIISLIEEKIAVV